MDVDEGIVDRIRQRFERRGLTMPEINRRQAMVPRGAMVVENPRGTAPGLWIERSGTGIALLPGPPREMTPMLEALIAERLQPRSGGAGLFRRVLKITGRTESDVDARAQPLYSQWLAAPIPIATTILAVMGQIELHLTASAASRAEGETALELGGAAASRSAGPDHLQRRRPATRGGHRRSAASQTAHAVGCGIVLGRTARVADHRCARQF